MSKSDYNGYLLKFGSTQLPNSFINEYVSTPNQRTEKKAWRDNNEALQRVTSPNFKTTLKVAIRAMSLGERDRLDSIKASGLTNATERKYQVTYWNLETSDYASGYFYIPDTEYSIQHIADNDHGEMYYKAFTLEMIEY